MEFAGFTPKQKYALLKGMDYTGSAQSDEMDAFLASSPSAASMMGEYSKIAQQRVEGRPLSGIGMAEGGFYETPQPIVGGDNPDLLLPPDTVIDDPEQIEAADITGGYDPDAVPANDTFIEGEGTTADAETGMVGLNTSTNVSSGTTTTEVPATIDPTDNTDNLNDTGASETMVEQTTNGYTGVDDFTTESGGTALNTLQSQLAEARQKLAALTTEELEGETGQALLKTITDRENKITIAQQNIGDSAPSGAELVATGMNKPSALVTKPEVTKITENANQLIGVGTGKVTDAAAAGTTTVSNVSQAGAVTTPGASTYTADKSSDDVTAETSKLSAAQLDGLTKSISAQSYTVDQLNFLGFNAAQIAQYQKVGTVTDIPELTDEQKIKAAVLADIEIPEAVAQTLTFDPVAFKADAAKFVGDTPEATAAKDYNLGLLSGAKSTVDVATEIISGAGGDLEAAQAKAKESLRLIQVGYADGTVSLEQLAKAQNKYGEVITSIASGSVTDEMKVDFAGGDLEAAQAKAKETLKLIEVGYAEGTVTQDQLAKAQTEYKEVIASIASGSVTAEMLVNFAGGLLSPEQAADIASKYESGLEAAKGKVSLGETIGPQDTYNLDPAAIAEIAKTAIIDPATNTDFPEGTAATTEYESIIEGASGEIGADELINADNIGINKELVAQSVFAVAKTMEQVNDSAKMKAATATFSQSALAEAAAGVPQAMSTVKGQLSTLMNEFKDGTPAWAAGAVRAANALMASRGLGGSSMAGAAIIQAALESALPIAEQDARFYQEMNMTNLSNKQAVSLANAAAVQGIELRNLDNEQATALKNSTQAFELQSMNLSNLQGTVLANLNVKASIQNKSLDINTQSAVSNAARYAELNNINLSNEQQSLLQESSENLQLELSELSNSQQMSLSMLQTKAALMGQNLSNEQQTAMLESTQLFEAANFNASAQQQAFMQDAQAQAALEGRALDTRQQTALFNAARIATVNDVNLTNEQQVLLAKSTENLQVEVQNLSNRQQTELANTQLRAALQGKVLDNEQQAAVLDAAQYAETNNINLSHEQQAFVQDAVSKAAMEGKVLDNRQQAMLFNVARAAEVADISLNNEQQSLILESNQAFNQDITNLSNRQQTELANTQLRAALQGKVLDNEQQAAILNAAQYAETQNINLSHEQQAFVQDAVSKAAMEGKVLDNSQQAMLFNAARAAQVADINLTNEQQSLILETNQAFDQDMTNLSNRQQTELGNAQLRAALQGKVLDNNQQAAILNSTRYAEANNITVTNKQQALIQDYASRTVMEGKVLDNKQQAAIFNISNEVQERGLELTNQQQVNLFNTANNLEVEVGNLSNKQQTELANAQIEASLRGQELSNKQQAKVLNASRISEIANINFNAEQQREIENARLSSTVDLANLDSKSAKMLSEMASLAAMDTSAMNNRQQAEVQNAQNFLQMDLSNLNNEQQTSVFKSQQNIAALFNDQAAENAKLQFNAASENQVNQFFADLQVNVGKFNVDQANAIKQFNAGETNAVDKFNAQLKSVRNQFNSSNALLIEQANTKWKQDIATMDTAAQNEANHVAAKMAAEITSSVMDQVWQRERDLMSFAFTATEGLADRALEILMGDKIAAIESLKLDSADENARDYMITKMLLGDWT